MQEKSCQGVKCVGRVRWVNTSLTKKKYFTDCEGPALLHINCLPAFLDANNNTTKKERQRSTCEKLNYRDHRLFSTSSRKFSGDPPSHSILQSIFLVRLPSKKGRHIKIPSLHPGDRLSSCCRNVFSSPLRFCDSRSLWFCCERQPRIVSVLESVFFLSCLSIHRPWLLWCEWGTPEFSPEGK